MYLLFYHVHKKAKRLKIISFGFEFERVLPKKWNDDFREIASVVDLVPVAIPVIRPRIFLEIHTAASKECFQIIQDILVCFDKLDIELGLHDDTPFRFLLFIDIPDIDSEASFTIHETHNVIRVEFEHSSEFLRLRFLSDYYDSADF
jgi:hypothetical protein